jgi:hypothetical protein
MNWKNGIMLGSYAGLAAAAFAETDGMQLSPIEKILGCLILSLLFSYIYNNQSYKLNRRTEQ